MTAPWLEFMMRHKVTITDPRVLDGERGGLTGGTATLGTNISALVAPLSTQELRDLAEAGELYQATARLYVTPDQEIHESSAIIIESGPGWPPGTRFQILSKPTVYPLLGTDESVCLSAFLREEAS